MKNYRIQIIGRVQGVAFRYYTKLKADELGLMGTTQNQKDGSVIILVQGNENVIDRLIKWCYRGSPASEVKEVNFRELSASESQEFKDFSILR